MHNFTRRELLKLGATTAVAELASWVCTDAVCSVTPRRFLALAPNNRHRACGDPDSGEPVFRSLLWSTVAPVDFSDQSMAFQQPDPRYNDLPRGTLSFHLDTSTTNAACTHDITHDWVPQHQSWHDGAMDVCELASCD